MNEQTIDLGIVSVAQAEAICPKHMRHGPCGGVHPGNLCEVDETLTCPYLEVLDKLPWRLNGPLPGLVRSQANQGKLAKRLRSGGFAVVAEVYPPSGVNAGALLQRYQPFRDRVDAVNVADNPLSTPYLSALVTAALFARHGFSTVLNITCRDRNLIGLQAELLGAAALGVENIFCVTGDHPALGNQTYAQPVFQLDSLELIALARRLRDEGPLEHGRTLDSRPNYLIGAVASPFSIPSEIQAERAAAKVAAGAEFLQTQAVFNLKLFQEFIQRLTDLGALAGAWLIAGVAVATKLEQALWLQTQVPGSPVPQEFVSLLRRTAPAQRRATALAYIADLIGQIRRLPEVSGVLVFPLNSDVESMGELLQVAGLGE
ncbi:MAG: methylenetetrahydrofolate reductase C-terminal domain-containing protein [Chloroflexota bacterium]